MLDTQAFFVNLVFLNIELVMDNTACSKEQALDGNDCWCYHVSTKSYEGYCILMSQAGSSRAAAIKALRDNDGDLRHKI